MIFCVLLAQFYFGKQPDHTLHVFFSDNRLAKVKVKEQNLDMIQVHTCTWQIKM